MNEIRRTAYLDAMGIETYVSRGQLPGAAPTRRLVITAPAQGGPATRSAMPGELRGQEKPEMPSLASIPGRKAVRSATQPDGAPPGFSEGVAGNQPVVPRFSLSAIVAGRWLWLEELGDMPLRVEQVHLVEAMARALQGIGAGGETGVIAKPQVTQFDWPIHTNRQLALGEDAALVAVGAFAGRKIEELGCVGVVVLGEACAARVSAAGIGIPTVFTASTAEMLLNPVLKARVWRDLQPLCARA